MDEALQREALRATAEELQRAKEALEAACSETEGRAALAQSAAAAATEAAEASALLAESGVRDAQLAAEEEKAEVRSSSDRCTALTTRNGTLVAAAAPRAHARRSSCLIPDSLSWQAYAAAEMATGQLAEAKEEAAQLSLFLQARIAAADDELAALRGAAELATSSSEGHALACTFEAAAVVAVRALPNRTHSFAHSG